MRGRENDGVVQRLVSSTSTSTRASGSSARRYPCLKLDAIRHLSQRRAAFAGRDRHRDRQLPRRGAAGRRAARRPQPARRQRDHRLGRRPSATGTRARPARARARRDLRRRHLRPRGRARAGALSQRGLPPRAGRVRCRSCARGATARSPPDECRLPDAAPRSPVDAVHLRPGRGLPLPTSAPLEPSTARAAPTRRTASSARPTMQLVIPVKLGPRTQLWDIAFTGVKSVSEKERRGRPRRLAARRLRRARRSSKTRDGASSTGTRSSATTTSTSSTRSSRRSTTRAPGCGST